LEAGSVPPNLTFPQLDFVKPSSGFHPVTWERVSKGLQQIQLPNLTVTKTFWPPNLAMIKKFWLPTLWRSKIYND
jgi:hypothetical protein